MTTNDMQKLLQTIERHVLTIMNNTDALAIDLTNNTVNIEQCKTMTLQNGIAIATVLNGVHMLRTWMEQHD